PLTFGAITSVLALIDPACIVMLSIACGVMHDLAVFGRAREVSCYFGFGVAVATLFSTAAYARGLYSKSQMHRLDLQVQGAILIWMMVFLCLLIVASALKVNSAPPLGTVLLFFVMGFGGIAVLRWGARRVLAHASRSGVRAKQQVIVVAQYGTPVSPSLAQAISASGRNIWKTISLPAMCNEPGLSETMRELNDHVRRGPVDEILLAVSCTDGMLIEVITEHLRVLPLPVMLIPDAAVSALLERPLLEFGSTRAIELQGAPLTRPQLAAKRLLDILLAGFGLLILLPALGVTAVLILLDSPGPVLFCQRRIGLNGRPFHIYKFRTMRTIEDGSVIRQASRDDMRITGVGRVLRKFSIDELPQLFNVLKGEMSLVGPRPHALAHDNEYGQAIPVYAARHNVKPGITGWAQVNGWRGATPKLEMMMRRVEHDLWYVNHWSLWLDIKILMLTVVAAWNDQNAY